MDKTGYRIVKINILSRKQRCKLIKGEEKAL